MTLLDTLLSLKKLLKDNLGLIALCIGLVIGLVVIALSFFFGINQYGIGFAIIGASLAYLMFLRFPNIVQYSGLSIRLDLTKQKLVGVLYFCIYSLSLIIIYVDQYNRSILYFSLISLLAALIVIDILTENNVWSPLIFIKILLLALNIRYGLFYEFNGLSGGDIWTHARMISNSLDAGSITDISMLSSKYFYYPVFHSLLSIACLIPGIAIKSSIFYSIVVVNVLVSLIIYNIGRLVGDERLGMLAILIYFISDIPIQKTTLHIEPLTLVVIYFCLILWLFIKPAKIERSILILILFISIIMAHQLGALASLYIVIIFSFSLWLYRHFSSKCASQKLSGSKFYLLILMGVALIFYWSHSYVACGSDISFFEYAMQPLEKVLTHGLGGDLDSLAYVKVLASYDFVSNILFQLGYFVLLFFAVFGVLHWFNAPSRYKFAIVSAIIGLYIIIWGLPLTKVGNAGMFTRWLIFSYIFMVFPAADAILLLSSQLYSKCGKVSPLKYVPIVIVFLLCFAMITTPYINGDSPVHSKDRWPRSMFEDTELAAVDTISRVYSNPITSDAFYPVVFTMSSFTGELRTLELASKGDGQGALLLRTCAVTEPVGIKTYGYEIGVTKIVGQDYFDYIYQNRNLSLVYDNEGAIFYVPH